MKVWINNWVNIEEIEAIFEELINSLPTTKAPGEVDENGL